MHHIQVVCDIWNSVFSSSLLYYATQTEMLAAKLFNFIIRNYIQFVTFNQINIFVPAHLINPDFFTPFLTWDNRSENINVFVFTET